MNKYQKAINLINISAYSQYEDACYNTTTKAKAMQHERLLNSSAYLLQELVDKEMPRATKFIKVGSYIDDSYEMFAECPECEFNLQTGTNYCGDCGQRLDWKV